MSTEANALKIRGNELFKAGAFLQASKLYAEAEEADAQNPVYPSNLSAALFELGDYWGCIEAGLRAWEHLKDKSDEKSDLIARLSIRLAKALCHGVRTGKIKGDMLASQHLNIDQLRVVSTEGPSTNAAFSRAWEAWDETKSEMDECEKKGSASLRGLARLPMFFKPMDHTKEYYMIGHDDLKDLTAGWGDRFPQPLDFSKFSVEEISDVAFLFGGVGDGRHALATLCGLRKAYDELPDQKKVAFRAHLTLLDINEVSVARNLCLFTLLDDLNHASDATERMEIKTTLMYMFCGAVMPSYCYRRLEKLFREIPARLRTNANLPPWMHADPHTIARVSDAFDYWLTASKPAGKMLAEHQLTPRRSSMPPASFRPGRQPGLKRSLEEKLAAERAEIRDTLLHMPHSELIKSGFVSPTSSAASARAELHRNMDALVEELHETMFGDPHTFEVEWYEKMKVFLPPEPLRSQHDGFAAAWQQVQDKGDVEWPVLRKAASHIESDWRTNITLFARYYDDPRCRYGEAQRGYPNMRLNLFDTVDEIHTFNRRDKDLSSMDMDVLAFDVCSTFFEEVAAALKNLENHVNLEFRVGGLCEELAKMRCDGNDAHRDGFPMKYTRMWLSNVPDYTHGPLNLFVYVVPSLQDHPQAAVACNCLLNTSAWRDDEEFMHTYTLLRTKEVPRYLGGNIIDPRAVMDVLVLGPSLPFPRPLSELATRDELTTWLTQLLFNTFMPGQTQPPPWNIRLPHNLVAFFGILMHLHQVGYPAHWLSDFLGRVLSGRMVSDISPYTGKYPIPVRERNRRVSSRTVRTDPWLVEFETIIATAYYAVPFPITPALPADFSRDPDDIALWEVPVRPSGQFMMARGFHGSPYEPRVQLLFYRSDKLSAAEVIRDMERVFEGQPAPAPGLFFILTAPEDVMYHEKIQFRLSKRRVESMRKEKWSMVPYRNDTGVQGTPPVPISCWIAKS